MQKSWQAVSVKLNIYNAKEAFILLIYLGISIVLFFPILSNYNTQLGHSIDWTVPNDPLLLKRQFENNHFIWWDNFLGQDRQWYIYNFFYTYLFLLPSQLFSISGGSLISLYILATSISASYLFYRLSKNLLNNFFPTPFSFIISFLAGLFYGLSAYKVNFLISGEFFGVHFGIVIIPLLLYVLLNYLRNPSLSYVIYASIAFVALLLAWVQYILLVSPIIVVLIVVLGVARIKARLFVKHLFFFSAIIFLLTSWFLPITFFTREYEVELSSDPFGEFRNADITFPVGNAIFDIDWSWHYLVRSLPILYFIYAPIVGIMLTAVLLEREKKARLITIPIGIVAFLYLGLASGTFGPLSNLFIYLIENDVYPVFFQLLRSPVGFLTGYHILISILLIFGLRLILNFFKTQRSNTIVQASLTIAFLLAVIIPHTVWFTSIDENISDESDAFPDLYKENHELLDFYHGIDSEDGNFRVLMIPPSRGAVFMANDFQRARPYAEDPLMLWSPKQAIDVVRTNPYVKEGVDRLVMGLSSQNLGEILYYLKTFNIKYIVLRNDVSAPQWSIANKINNAELERLLTSHKNLFMEKKLGEYIRVYEFTRYEEDRIGTSHWSNRANETEYQPISSGQLRIEPPYCSDVADLSTSRAITTIRIEGCNNDFVSIVKPFLIKEDMVYKFSIRNFSINTPYHIKVYFQDLEVEQSHNGIIQPLSVHGKDAYYFYLNASTPENRIRETNSLTGYFDTYGTDEDRSNADSNNRNMAGYVSITVDMNMRNHSLLSLAGINLFEVNDYSIHDDNISIDYSMDNPTLWKLKVNTSEAFTLDFHESFSPWWEAVIQTDGQDEVHIGSVLLHDGINSFNINNTGVLNIQLRYIPQTWFETGLIVAGVTAISLVVILILDRTRSRIPFLWMNDK
jgi:hypothetical protein